MIRDIQMADVPLLISYGAAMHAESIYAPLDFDPAKLMALAEVVLDNRQIYYARLVEKDGEPVGFIVGYVAPHFFGNDLTCGDFLVYVTPEARGSMAGPRLIKDYINWCLAKGVKMPCLGVSAGIDAEQIGALYKRLGLTDTYTIYRMPVAC